jgi:hypothetical protein
MTRLPIAACVLIASAGIASAQTTIITREPVQTETVITRGAPPPMVVERRAPVVVEHQRLVLTPVQRRTIYRTIVRDRATVATTGSAVEIGARIPAETRLYEVPQTLAVEVPAIQRYRYMVINDRVLLVDPATSTVAAEIAD